MNCNLCGHPLGYHEELDDGKFIGWKCKSSGCDCFLRKGRGINSKEFYGKGDND
jgi:hypothetical protein